MAALRMKRIVIVVEGLFDRLALLAANFVPGDVIAVGTDSANLDWLPLSPPCYPCL